MNSNNDYKKEIIKNVARYGDDSTIFKRTTEWMSLTSPYKYSYNFQWMGRPIIQYPQDIVAMQEIIWDVQPDLIIETGIAHGGSLIFNASMLALIEYCNICKCGKLLDPHKPRNRIVGIDIDIRPHNRAAIEKHPLSNRIDMIEGSSTDPLVIEKVKKIAQNYSRILVCLDSNHTQDHVLAELEAFAPLVSLDSYCVVFDTIIEDMPDALFVDRPWGSGNNPKTAVWEYLRILHEEGRKDMSGNKINFEVDQIIEKKLLITVAPNGYLKRVK